MRVSLKQIKEDIRAMDPYVDETTFNAAVVTLASAFVGPNIRRLKKFTKLPMNFVALIGHRLRKNGVWIGTKVAADWDNHETGGISFWLDVNVALGLMKRTP